jgi:hypothetical protein
VWSADGKSIVALVAGKGKPTLSRFDVATGKSTDVTTGIRR